MKMRRLARRGMVVQTLALMATCVGFIVVGCTDEPLDMRPTLGAGSAGKAGSSTTSGGGSTNALSGGGGDGGGEGGASTEAGAPATVGSGGGVVSGGGSGGGGGGMSNALCGNNNVDPGEECDDGNKVSGDGCSYDCKNTCEKCEKDTCPADALQFGTVFGDAYTQAYGVQGVAAQGPSVGTPRIDLLRKLLQCAYETNCTRVVHNTADAHTSQITLRPCGCTIALSPGADPSQVPADCENDDKIQKGPCYSEMQAAAEADTANEVFTRMNRRTYAIGLAYTLLQFCDARYCAAQCVPDEAGTAACVLDCASSGGTGATGGTGSGGTSGGTDTGGTAGTGGASGPVCGNGIKELGEECDPPKTAQCSDECLGIMSGRCAQLEASGACAPLASACLDGPGAATPEDQSACYHVSECILHTQCSNSFTKGPFTKCFCGALSDSDCATAPETGQGSPAGPCAAVIKAGMGPGATNADVMARYTDPSYPAGAALNRYTCLNKNPLSDCDILDDCDPNVPCPQPLTCYCAPGHI